MIHIAEFVAAGPDIHFSNDEDNGQHFRVDILVDIIEVLPSREVHFEGGFSQTYQRTVSHEVISSIKGASGLSLLNKDRCQ